MVAGACVLTWYIVAPHLPRLGLWGDVTVLVVAVLPGTLLLVYLALPLAGWSWAPLAVLTGVFVAAAVLFWEIGWSLPANFAKLFAAVFAGWLFLTLFEKLSWIVIVAVLVPFADAISVWRGPTHAITANPKHFHIYTDVAIAFLVPGGGAASFGPPDIIFFALFLAAAQRWGLRVGWTWIATTGMYGLAIVIAYAVNVSGLAALPFLSAGFLGVNADLLWRRFRPSAGSSSTP